MLVISRKIEQALIIGENVEIKILDVFALDGSGSRKSKVASIGISAPREIKILRKELYDTQRENKAAEQSARNISGASLGELMRKKRSGTPDKPGGAT